ncbi:MAG: sulfotransferase [Actinocatenispora sp.]
MSDAEPGRRPVFVGGLHRSGTSLVAECLASHPSIGAFHGGDAPENEGQYLQTTLPSDEEHGGPGRFALAPEAHMTESSPLAGPETAERLWRQWSRYWQRNGPYVLEKSPANLLRCRLLQKLFPGAAFVLIVRHPVSVTLSTIKWTPSLTPLDLLHHWVTAHDIAFADVSHLRRVLTVRYEDLIADRAGELGRIARFLGLLPSFGPAEITSDLDRRYARQWAAIRPLLPEGALHALDARTARYGYSLLDRAVPGLDLRPSGSAGG